MKNKLYHKLSLCFLLMLSATKLAAQDDLMQLLEADSLNKNQTQFTAATFKGTRIINGHSIETTKGGVLQFLISHRFGTLNTGAYNFFGLDQATIRLGLEYGVNNRLTFGVGRSSLEKTYDGFGKFKLLRQSSGTRNMPVSVVLFSSIALTSLKFEIPDRDNLFSSRLSYTYQVIIARKFNEKLSLQLAPTLVHHNLVPTATDNNDVYAVGFAGRHKLTKRTALNIEYFYTIPQTTDASLHNSLSVGFDIETGGHVFQLHLTNSQGMIEKFFVPGNIGSWSDGDIYFGFNISRSFTLKKNENK